MTKTTVGAWRSLAIGVSVGAALIGGVLSAGAADPPALVKKTWTYKTVGETAIQVDIYRADDTQVRPVVVWLHGGALVMGSRSSVPQRILDLCRAEGYVLASFDYRLAPEVKVPAIIEDVQDAFRWLRGAGATLAHVDPQHIVVTGGSAGGYLTMMTGICVQPRPRALVAFWGYGDVDGDWYTQPSDFYRTQVPLVSRDDAFRTIGGPVLAGTESNTPEQKGRGQFYHYLRQNGLWTREVTGFDPAKQREQLDPFCPVRQLSANYPPILMIHGTTDTDVPFDKSVDMADALTRLKLRHELIAVPNAGHGLAGGDKQLVEDAHTRALAFIREHLK